MAILNFNKKGNVITDVLLLIIIFFVFCLTVFIGYQFTDDLNADIQTDSSFNNDTKDLSQNMTDRYPTFFDGLIALILILLWCLVLVASFNIDAHPIFFGVMLILFIFVIVVVVDIGNTFEEITNEADLVDYRDDFPITVWVFDHLLAVVLSFAATVMLVLYGKSRLG